MLAICFVAVGLFSAVLGYVVGRIHSERIFISNLLEGLKKHK
jgi:VIT1/CCC1 family predicted Fe2+/Mn2+ transporter